jgi:hypothetical protein
VQIIQLFEKKRKLLQLLCSLSATDKVCHLKEKHFKNQNNFLKKNLKNQENGFQEQR